MQEQSRRVSVLRVFCVSVASARVSTYVPATVARLNLEVSDEAHAGWTAFAKRHGMSVSVLFEILGRHLTDDVFKADVLRRLAEEGRDLTHERRRAGGPRPKERS